jgi:hypothetical protein
MRTTFTIDADLVPKIKSLVRRKKNPMRKVLNDLIRAAIGAEVTPRVRPFEVKSAKLGLKIGYDLMKLNSVFDELESDDFGKD